MCLLFTNSGFSLPIDTATFNLQVDSLYQMKPSATSLAFAEKLNQQATKAKYLNGEALVKLWIAPHYTNTGTYDTALTYSQQVLSIGENLKNKTIVANANLTLGNLCLATRAFEKSITY